MDSVNRRDFDLKDTFVLPNEMSIDEWEEIMFSADEPLERETFSLIDWDLFGDNKRRCKGCDKFKKEKGYGDFICKHVKGFREAPRNITRCTSCDAWKRERGTEGDFWCKHRKHDKKIWDDLFGWEGASERAKVIKKTYRGR